MKLTKTLQKQQDRTRNIIYRGYKTPLIPVLEPFFGYEGIISEDADTGEIQCHICGAWKRSVAAHLQQHGDFLRDNALPDCGGQKIVATSYKDMFGLLHGTALVSTEIREKLIATQALHHDELLDLRIANMKKGNKDRKYARRNNLNAMEKKNKDGNCYEQLLDQIRKLAWRKERTPFKRELRGYNGGSIDNTIRRTYGSIKEAYRICGLKQNRPYAGNAKNYEPTKLTKTFYLRCIQAFIKENKRYPAVSDCNNFLLPDISQYRKHFGTFRLAIKEYKQAVKQ